MLACMGVDRFLQWPSLPKTWNSGDGQLDQNPSAAIRGQTEKKIIFLEFSNKKRPNKPRTTQNIHIPEPFHIQV